MKIVIPTFPDSVDDVMLETEYYRSLKVYLEELSKLSLSSAEWYKEIVVRGIGRKGKRLPKEEEKERERIERLARSGYEYVSTYLFTNYTKKDFRRMLPCRANGEDLVRKYSLMNHVFWEICRLYPVVYLSDVKRDVETLGRDKAIKRMARDEEVLRLYGRYIVEGSPQEFSQREINQAFFLLGGCWKTARYSGALSRYAKALVARMCDFFCYSSTRDELDEGKMRCPIESSKTMPTVFKPSQGQRRRGREDGKIPSPPPPPSASRKRRQYYYPNLDYCVASQIRFYHYMGDLTCYEDRKKRSLDITLKANLEHLYRLFGNGSTSSSTIDSGGRKRSRGGGGRGDTGVGYLSISQALARTVVRYEVRDWLSVQILKEHSIRSCEKISPEQKEKTCSQCVYNSFSEADRDWLKYKNPISLPSFADEFISKECRDTAYDEVVKKTGRSYSSIYAEDGKSFSDVGFYEWCVIKNVSRLFALKFDLFEDFVFEKEMIKNDPEIPLILFSDDKPSIVQFFTEYRVFYKGELYVSDEKFEDILDREDLEESKVRLETTIYDTLLLWITIMLKDFPKDKISEGLIETLQNKSCEIALANAKADRSASNDLRCASSAMGGSFGAFDNNGGVGEEGEDMPLGSVGMDVLRAAAALRRMGDDANDNECDDAAERVERKRRRTILRREIASATGSSTSSSTSKIITSTSRGSKGVDDTDSREYFAFMQRNIEKMKDKVDHVSAIVVDDNRDDSDNEEEEIPSRSKGSRESHNFESFYFL